MATPLRVLIIDDSADDAELLLRTLRRGGFAPVSERVETAEAMSAVLVSRDWDVVIADYAMPQFSGVAALIILRQLGLDLPFLIVSGKISEESAVAAMRAGAHDYILKDNLTRLVPAITRELRDAEERRARRRAEESLRQAEIEKKQFYRDVIRAVTNNKLHLVDPGEIPSEGERVLDVSLDDPQNLPLMRRELREIAERAGMSADQSDDAVLALGEAATNAIRHGTGGRCEVYLSSDSLIGRVSDRGHGIHPGDLPGAILQPGFSTQISLGMGYSMILQLMDRIWLATGPEGTVVQLRKWLRPEEHLDPPLLALMERF